MRLTQSFMRPERNIWRWAASWPRKAIWVISTASTAAGAICHQLSPIHTTVRTHAAIATTAPMSLDQ